MPKTNSSWIENAHSYLIKHCLFSLMKPCSPATLSLPTCGVLRGSFNHCCCQPVGHCSSQHTDPGEHQCPTVSQLCMMQPQQCGSSKLPLHSLAQTWPFGEVARTAPEGSQGSLLPEPAGMANSSLEGRLVFPAVKTANRGGSQRCPCYPTYRHCYK